MHTDVLSIIEKGLSYYIIPFIPITASENYFDIIKYLPNSLSAMCIKNKHIDLFLTKLIFFRKILNHLHLLLLLTYTVVDQPMLIYQNIPNETELHVFIIMFKFNWSILPDLHKLMCIRV